MDRIEDTNGKLTKQGRVSVTLQVGDLSSLSSPPECGPGGVGVGVRDESLSGSSSGREITKGPLSPKAAIP